MAPDSPDVQTILATQVFMNGANRPFGELTLDDVRARARELREAAGWGTARVAQVAQAWLGLAVEMQERGAAKVADLDGELLTRLAPALWIVLPV